MFTYAERRDLPGFECFVGAMVTDKEIFVREAGENCQRGLEPVFRGMKLLKKGM